MAHNNTEIEIKVPVGQETFLAVNQLLKTCARFAGSSEQADEYFTPCHRNFVEPKFPFEWLSIRQRGGTSFISYKHWHPENVEEATHCDEFETPIHDPDQLRQIFLSLDFKRLVTVKKVREKYVYGDAFEISLDHVNELGCFIEIEALKDFGGIEKTREEIFSLSKELGIDASKRDKRGYPYLVMAKRGLMQA